jgi:1-acyl-sn-glycerol-3-phosphate acyltransferase
MNVIWFLLVYIIVMLLYSIWLYNQVKIFYKPLFYIKNGKKNDVHSLYPEFAVKDKLSFARIFIGNLLFFPWKILLPVSISVIFNLHLNYYNKTLKNPTTNPKERKIITSLTSFYTNILFILMNFKIVEKKVEYEKIYKKYLGEDYDFNDQNFSLYICNHIGFFEVIYNMAFNATGFIAKKEVESFPFVGVIAKAIKCLFVNRENEQSRKKIFEELEERQKNFYNKKSFAPLCLFPEGTTTNGKFLLKFKKGAFFALLPVKPLIINIDQNADFHLSIGVAPVWTKSLRSHNYLTNKIIHIDFPVIRPTKFMFEKYKHLGNEKWEIFAEVSRLIMCELGNLTPSNKTFRDSKIYENACVTGIYDEKYLNEEKYESKKIK